MKVGKSTECLGRNEIFSFSTWVTFFINFKNFFLLTCVYWWSNFACLPLQVWVDARDYQLICKLWGLHQHHLAGKQWRYCCQSHQKFAAYSDVWNFVGSVIFGFGPVLVLPSSSMYAGHPLILWFHCHWRSMLPEVGPVQGNLEALQVCCFERTNTSVISSDLPMRVTLQGDC